MIKGGQLHFINTFYPCMDKDFQNFMTTFVGI